MHRPLTILLLIASSVISNGLLAAEEDYWEYTFRPGDSIWKIAERYTTTVNNWVEINRVNNILLGPDRKIKPGTRIVVPVSMLKRPPAPALVLAVKGKAIGISKKGESRELVVGDKLYTGTKILTRLKQRVVLQFADLSELQISPNSEVVLDQISYHKNTGMADTRIRLNIGSINTIVKKQKVNSRYEISTPASVTAVRGTAFRLSSNLDRITRTEVTEGIVNVSKDTDDVNVLQYYGIITEEGKQLSTPVKLLKAPKLNIKIRNKDAEIYAFWPNMDRARYYVYEISSDIKFNDILASSTTRDNSISIDAIDIGKYFLRVRGVHRNGLEGLNSISAFEIQKHVPEKIVTYVNKDTVIYDDKWYAAFVWLGYLLIFTL